MVKNLCWFQAPYQRITGAKIASGAKYGTGCNTLTASITRGISEPCLAAGRERRRHVSGEQQSQSGEMTEERAYALVTEAIESIGGPQNIYRNPRMAYAFNSVRDVEIDGHSVEIRYGEISTPAIATLEGWVFEIHDQDIELLMKPVKRRKT